MEDSSVHNRVLKLRDVALGVQKAVKLNSELASASYDCALDSLLALHIECKSASGLANDRNVQKFTRKYEGTISVLEKLRICAEDFEIKNTIGSGHFGEVMVCHEKSTGDVFAMKIMKKAHILQQPDAYNSAERDIMAWSTSPWLTTLHYAFQDHTSLYLVMDYHPGGDLRNVMGRKEGMEEDEARFYLAEITAGLHDLHNMGFVHRDVKPENVLIARSGHIKLADFGSVASLNTRGKVMDSQLPVGTPEYIAPEVFASLNTVTYYGTCCDWWSLGVIAYELLYDVTPFEGGTTSKTYNKIMNYKNSLTFPDEAKCSSEEVAQDFIKSLLTDIQDRLSYTEIQSHAFFSLTQWNHLLQAVPPYVPKVSAPDDVSNFDVFERLKENDLKCPRLPSKNTTFCGKTLPFIGFTFNRLMTSMDNYTNSIISQDENTEAKEAGSEDLKENNTIFKKELEDEKKKCLSLERECEVYQSQVEDYQHRLETERSDRHVSESRALQMLQDMKEKAKMSQQLREEQMRTIEVEFVVVKDQLEQEKQGTSNRAQKLQHRLKEIQQEKDTALKRMTDYQLKLTEAKETSRKEIANLQEKLIEMSMEASSKASEVQNNLQEVQKCYTDTLDQVKVAENANRKSEFELQNLQTNMNEYSITTRDISQQLKELKNINDSLQSKVDGESKASEDLRKQSVVFAQQVKELETQLEEAYSEKKNLLSDQQSLEYRVRELEEWLEDTREAMAKFKAQSETDERIRSEALRRKHEEIVKLEANSSSLESRLMDDKYKASWDERMRTSVEKAESLGNENIELKKTLFNLREELTTESRERESLKIKMEEVEKKSKMGISDLRTEVRSLQSQLGETTTMALQEGDKLREVRKAYRELDHQNESFSIKLREAQRESELLKKQLKVSRSEVEDLCIAQDQLKQAQLEIEMLQSNNKSLKNDTMSTKKFLKEVTISSDQAQSKALALMNKFDTQELNAKMLQRMVASLEDQLKEAQTIAQEAQKELEHVTSVKEVLENDLAIAEAQVDEITQSKDNENKARLAGDQKLIKATADMEKLIVDQSEDLQMISSQLVTQTKLGNKHSSKVLELETEIRLKVLALLETQKELDTEKAVSSKFYDQILSKSRELCMLKAAHMKLLKEVQHQKSELAQRDQVLDQQQIANEERQVQEMRLQATILQQKKLIDYLQGMDVSPELKGRKALVKIKKVVLSPMLKFKRKGRDPAKEIAEWNKLKGIAKKGRVVQNTSTLSISSSSSHSNLSLTTPSSHLTPNSCTIVTSTSSAVTDVQPTNHTEMTSDGHLVMDVCNSLAVRCPTTPASKITVDCNREAVEASQGQLEKQQNTPHEFSDVSKFGKFSHFTCTACKGPIRAPQKLTKCKHCHVAAHTHCINSIPNNCGIPEKLSSHIDLSEPEAKKAKLTPEPSHLASKFSSTSRLAKKKRGRPKKIFKQESERLPRTIEISSGLDTGVFAVLGNQQSSLDQDLKNAMDSDASGGDNADTQDASSSITVASSEHVGCSGEIVGDLSNSTSDGEVLIEKTVNCAVFEMSEVIKMERMRQPRGGILTDGWLVLMKNVLSFYNRDPRSMPRNPINCFVLNQSDVAYVILSSISRAKFPCISQSISQSMLMNAFGLQINSNGTARDFCLVANSIQSKIDWIQGIQEILIQYGSPPLTLPSCRSLGMRVLKEVTIVPINSPPMRFVTSNTSRGAQPSIPAVHGSKKPTLSCAKSSHENLNRSLNQLDSSII